MPPLLEIHRRDPASGARTGTLHLRRGTVATPAFVPLATKGAVRGLAPGEVAGLGYEMVLGNTFHLWLQPGPERVAAAGGLSEFMRWDGPTITDSGGFQVFSLGHGGVAAEIKGREPAPRASRVLGIDERGVRFRSPLDGSALELTPERSMAIQAALHSDIALVFDECTPFHVDRDYTAASTERTHRWLDRCLAWHREHGPEGQVVYGIVQGGVHEDLRRASAQAVAATACDGIAIGGTLGEAKAQMHEVVGWATSELPEDRPRHLLGIGEIDDLLAGVAHGIDTFDCAMPTRIARHGMALVPDPAGRWRTDLAKARAREADEPILAGCPCPTCRAGYTRAYLHHLLRIGETLARRLITVHNLAFVERLMADLRVAVAEGTLAEVSAAVLAGAAPGGLAAARAPGG